MSLAIATWNVNSLRVRLDHLAQWTTDNPDVDVICLQETKVEDHLFPHDACASMGWIHRAVHGQKTYNGVAILSKRPLEEVQLGFAVGEPDEQARLIRATVDGVRVFGCYIPNGNSVGSPKFSYKLAWLKRLRAELAADTAPDRQVLVCGDFNIAPHEDDVWDPWAAENSILFHPLEHKALNKVTSWGLVDSLRQVHPKGNHFSWWDFRGGGFRRNQGFRIDHLWVTHSLANRLTDVRTDRDVRGWDRPSDHVPVTACFKDAEPS
ncbi:MAG: exodeoxyribonuclease III [Myxococcota bacterium]